MDFKTALIGYGVLISPLVYWYIKGTIKWGPLWILPKDLRDLLP